MAKSSSKLSQFWNGMKYDFEKLSESFKNSLIDFLYLIKVKKYDSETLNEEITSSRSDELKKQYFELANLCISENNLETLDKIISNHRKCLAEYTCEICKFIQDWKYSNPEIEYPWLLLAQNPIMTYQLHEKLYSLTFNWQNMSDNYVMKLIKNSNLDIKTRSIFINHLEFIVGHGNSDLVPYIYKQMLQHPKFLREELELFLEQAKEYNFYKELYEMYRDKFLKEEIK